MIAKTIIELEIQEPITAHTIMLLISEYVQLPSDFMSLDDGMVIGVDIIPLMPRPEGRMSSNCIIINISYQYLIFFRESKK